jgi:hypothetical protein
MVLQLKSRLQQVQQNTLEQAKGGKKEREKKDIYIHYQANLSQSTINMNKT